MRTGSHPIRLSVWMLAGAIAGGIFTPPYWPIVAGAGLGLAVELLMRREDARVERLRKRH